MLLAKIKEALRSLYDDIKEEVKEIPEAATEEVVADAAAAPAAADEVKTAASDAAPSDESLAEEKTADKKETEPEEVAEPVEPPGPKETDYKVKGYHLDVELPPEKIPEAAEILNREGFFIESVAGVDWIEEKQLEAVYDFNHFDELCRVVIRTRTDRDNPEIPTISHIYQGANWHERETHDFFGIKFTGHPNLEPLLLPEDADFHPLLKDFKA